MKAIAAKHILYEAGVLLALAVTAALTVNHFSPNGIKLLGQWKPGRGVASADAAKDRFHDFELNDPETAKQIYDSGKAVFVDARGQDAYEAGHIKGAVSLPLGEALTHIERFTREFPPDTYIVTYCSGRECTDSHRLAQILIDYGYRDVSIFIDGYPGWTAKGYPSE